MDKLLGIRAMEKKGIGDDGFVRQAAAAGFFPGEVLVVERDVKSRTGKPVGAKRSRRPAANDCDLAHVHAVDCRRFGLRLQSRVDWKGCKRQFAKGRKR